VRFSACSAVEYVNVVWEKVAFFRVCKRTFCGAQDNALLLILRLGLVQLVGTLSRRSLESRTVAARLSLILNIIICFQASAHTPPDRGHLARLRGLRQSNSLKMSFGVPLASERMRALLSASIERVVHSSAIIEVERFSIREVG
jgi:hypothetical protein